MRFCQQINPAEFSVHTGVILGGDRGGKGLAQGKRRPDDRDPDTEPGRRVELTGSRAPSGATEQRCAVHRAAASHYHRSPEAKLPRAQPHHPFGFGDCPRISRNSDGPLISHRRRHDSTELCAIGFVRDPYDRTDNADYHANCDADNHPGYEHFQKSPVSIKYPSFREAHPRTI